MPSNRCEGVKPEPLASRGALHCMCPMSLVQLPADAVKKDTRGPRSMVSLPRWQSRGVPTACVPSSMRLPANAVNVSTSKTKQFCETSSFFELDNVKNETSLRDFLNVWTWQHQKRYNSARLLHFLKVTTSKTKQACETSSMFELDNIKSDTILRDLLNFSSCGNIKNKASLRDVLQKWKVECRADGLVPMRFAIFPLHLKVLRLPRKSDARSYEVPHLSRKIIFPKLKIWCSKMQSLSGHQRPDLLNISDEHVSCTAPATENASLQILYKCSTPAIVFGNAIKPSHFAHFWQGAQSLAPAPRNDIWMSKSCPNMWCFEHFWLRNMLRATTACTFSYFFDISTSKSGPHLVCFIHFDLDMCFPPQQRALFGHLNFQKCSERGAFSFSTCKCASRHNGVHLFISHLARWLRTRRFSEPTFRPSRATNHWTNTVFRDFPTVSRACIFFLLTLSLLWSSLLCSSLLWLFPPLLFHLSILSEVWLLNFLRSYVICKYICTYVERWMDGWMGGWIDGWILYALSVEYGTEFTLYYTLHSISLVHGHGMA